MPEKKIVPWTKVGEEEVLAKMFGKKFVKQTFRNPETEKEDDYARFGQKDWSVVIPVTEDGQVVTVIQYKQGCDRITHELPAGTADFKDESPEEVMRRELLEETGYEPSEVISLGPPNCIATGSSWTYDHLFLAKGCKKVKEAKLDLNENIEVKLLSLAEWIELCHTTIFKHSAIVATFRALPHLGYTFAKPS